MFPLQISKLLEIFTIKAEIKTQPENGFKCPESKAPQKIALILLLGRFFLNK